MPVGWGKEGGVCVGPKVSGAATGTTNQPHQTNLIHVEWVGSAAWQGAGLNGEGKAPFNWGLLTNCPSLSGMGPGT